MAKACKRKWCRLNKAWLICLLLGSQAASGISLDWRVSRVHGLLNFAQTISGDQHRSKTLKEVFDKSTQAAANQAAVERFKKASARLDAGWTFPGFPTDRVVGQSLEELLLVQSALSADLDDFARRAQGLMPPSELAAYLAALKALGPVYETLVWGPSLSKLNALKDGLVSQAKSKDLSSLFAKAAVFYRAQWPEGLPLTIALYPIPGAQGSSSAESLNGVESLGVLVDRERGGDEFGVLFHELSHTLYEAQTAEFQNEWESYFRGSASESAEPAYVLINEAIATALGNGWAQEKIGSPRTGQWYDDASIDTFAHELYPMVKAYVEVPRPLDKEFAQKSIALLGKAIPGAARDLDFRLKKTLLIVEGKTEVPRRELRKHFSVSSLKVLSSLPGATDEMKKSRASLIVLVGRDTVSELTHVEKAVAGLRLPWAALRGRTGPVVYSVLQGHRPVIVIRADGEREVVEAFSRIGKTKRLDAKAPFLVHSTDKV